MNNKELKTVYFPKVLSELGMNNFITSLLLYDQINFDSYTFCAYILNNIPKKYHIFIVELDCIQLWDIYLREPMEGYYSEMKHHFIYKFGYSESEFKVLADKIKFKIKSRSRINTNDPELLKELIFSGTTEFDDIYDAIKIIKSKYFFTNDKALLSNVLNLSSIKIDVGNAKTIFEINRLPDFTNDVEIGNFNFENYVSLREKEGAKLFREVIFKEDNFNNHEELLREYNDIILREGLYDNKTVDRACWGLSNGLSIAGLFSGNIIINLGITFLSLLTGNYRFVIKSPEDKLEEFIKSDFRKFINSIK